MIHGPSTATILNTLQNTLQTIEEWYTEHRLEISKEKSALMAMFTRNRDEYKHHPTTVAWGINVVSKNEISRGHIRPQAGLGPPLTTSRNQTTAYSQQSCPLLQSHMGHVIS